MSPNASLGNIRPWRAKRAFDYSYPEYEAAMKECIESNTCGPPRKRKKGDSDIFVDSQASVNRARQRSRQIKLQEEEVIPSIEIHDQSSDDIISDKDKTKDEDINNTMIFVPQGVLVGFWYLDATGKGRQPVYCRIDRDFEFARLKDGVFRPVRWIDFDPLPDLEGWMGDDTEYDSNTEIMSPKEIQEWVEIMWDTRLYCGVETLGDYY